MESHNSKHDHGNRNQPKNNEPSKGLVKDPVCGMMIESTTAKGGHSEFHGQTFYFCNVKCTYVIGMFRHMLLPFLLIQQV